MRNMVMNALAACFDRARSVKDPMVRNMSGRIEREQFGGTGLPGEASMQDASSGRWL